MTGRGCGEYLLVNREDPRKHHYLRCRTWGCPVCGPRRARRVKGHIIDVAKEHRLNRLMTLTMRVGSEGRRDPTEYLMSKWNAFRTRLRQRYPDMVYLWVREYTKRGYPHLHILVNKYVPFEWLKGAWSQLGAGTFVNIKYVDMHRVVSYLSKYLKKDILVLHHPRKSHRWGGSRETVMERKVSPGGWYLETTPWAIRDIVQASGGIAWEEYLTWLEDRPPPWITRQSRHGAS